ncbi:MAG: response regulator [Bacteriovorax sp.]|jgi:DNA-binding NtrC family response regulator
MKPPRNHDKLRILIVDDSEFNRKNMTEILTTEGFNIVGSAGSAEDAIQLAHNSKANLIFIDVVMPDISGLELTKHFQEKHSGERFLIMMSSLNIESIVIESISNGAIDFLQKPFEREDLIKAVEKIERLVEKDR